jgi:hypothetical protein
MQNDIALFETWHLSLMIGGVIVIAAAILLLLVNAAAKRIGRLAATALKLVSEIKENTLCIWNLQQTNQVAEEVLKGSAEIKAHLHFVGDALHERDAKK